MKSVAVLTVLIIIASLLLAIPLAGCQREVSFTTASLSEANMCQEVDEDSRPVDATKVFAPDTSKLFLSVKLSNAPDDTEVKAEWVYVKGELEDVSDHLLGEYTVTTEYISFSLSSTDVWPTGDYKVVLYIDGKEKLTVPFAVE